ncbi:hypothetical protein VTO42DRAFT_7498 [Malbranchea cinnamomea]
MRLTMCISDTKRLRLLGTQHNDIKSNWTAPRFLIERQLRRLKAANTPKSSVSTTTQPNLQRASFIEENMKFLSVLVFVSFLGGSLAAPNKESRGAVSGIRRLGSTASVNPLEARQLVCPPEAPLVCPNGVDCCSHEFPRCCPTFCCPDSHPYCGYDGLCYDRP